MGPRRAGLHPRRVGLATGAYLALMAPLPALVAPVAASDLGTSVSQVVLATAWAWGGSLVAVLGWLEWSRHGGLTPSSRSIGGAFLVSALALAAAGLTSELLLFWVAVAMAGAAGPIVYPLQSAAVRDKEAPSTFEGQVEAWVFRANAAVPLLAALAADAGWWRAPFLGLAVAQAAIGVSFAVAREPRAERGPPVSVRRVRRLNTTKRAVATQAALYLGLGAFWSALSPLLSSRAVPLVVIAGISLARWPAGRVARGSGPVADYRAERTAISFALIPVAGFVIAALAQLLPGWGVISLLVLAAYLIEAGVGGANVASRRLVAGASAGLLMVIGGRSFGSVFGGLFAARLPFWLACAIGAAAALCAPIAVAWWRRRDVSHTLPVGGGRVVFRIARTGPRAGPQRRVEGWSRNDYVRWEDLHEGDDVQVRTRKDNLVILVVHLTQEITPFGRARKGQALLRRRRPLDVPLRGKRVARVELKGDLPAEVKVTDDQLNDGTPAVRVEVTSTELLEECRAVALKRVS
jgi:hypothetical protein